MISLIPNLIAEKVFFDLLHYGICFRIIVSRLVSFYPHWYPSVMILDKIRIGLVSTYQRIRFPNTRRKFHSDILFPRTATLWNRFQCDFLNPSILNSSIVNHNFQILQPALSFILYLSFTIIIIPLKLYLECHLSLVLSGIQYQKI